MTALREFWQRLTGRTADQRVALVTAQLDRLAQDLESAAQVAAGQAQDVRRRLAEALDSVRRRDTEGP